MSKPFLNRMTRPLQDLSTLIHRARGGYNEYAILDAIRRDPDRAMKRYGEIIIRQFSSWPCPLSMAVSLGASLVLVQELHTKFPNAIRDDRGRGWTPLHDACCFRAPYEVIQFLVEQYPLALEEDCGCGDTPLRVACSHNCDPEVVELLAERFPKAMIMEDDSGRTPIFIARQMLSVYERIGRRNTYPEVIDLLLTLHSLLCRDGTTDDDCDHGEKALTMLTSVGDDEKDGYRTWALPENSGPTQVFHITIPQDVAPGREFRVNAANHTVRIRCPPQIKPGTRLQITMPTNPVVTENLLVMVRRDSSDEKREYRKKKDSSSKGSSFFSNLFWKSNSVPVDIPHSKWSSRVAPILRHRTSVLQRMEIPSGVVPPLLERVGEEEDDNLETMFRIVRERMDLFQGMMQNQGFKAEQEKVSSFTKKKTTKSRRRFSSRRRLSVSLCSANETTPLQPGQVYFSTFLGIFLFLTVLAFNIGLKLGERWVETPNEPLIQRLNTAAQVDLHDVTNGLFGELFHPEVVLSALKGETSSRVDHQPSHDMTPTLMDFKSLSYGPTIYVNTDNQVEHYDNIAIQFNNTLNVPVQVRWIDIDGNSPITHVWTIDPKSEIRQLTSPGHLFVLSVLLSTTSPLRNTFDFSSDPFTNEESEPILFAYRPTKRLRSGFPHCVSIRYDTTTTDDAQQQRPSTEPEQQYIVETSLMDPSNFDAMIVHASTFDDEVLTTQNMWGKHKLIRLQHIVWSIMQHPTVDKYRRLRMSSPSIRRWGIHVSPGAIGILQTLGFRFTTVVVTPPKHFDRLMLEVESAAHNLATGPKVEEYLVCDEPTEEDMHQFRRVAEILVLLESREERPRFATDLMGPPVPWQRVSRL